MRPIAVLFLFIGMFLVVQGYYSNNMAKCPKPKTEIKFIPRSLYEEQLSPTDTLNMQFKSMFDDVTPGLRGTEGAAPKP